MSQINGILLYMPFFLHIHTVQIQVFWDVALCCWVYDSGCLKDCHNLIFRVKDCLTLAIKALQSFKDQELLPTHTVLYPRRLVSSATPQ
jgi:hypothetical protein